MGNGIGKLSVCFTAGGGGEGRRHHDISVYYPDPLDEGLGHSFCYVRPETASAKVYSEETTTFRSISGASVSANTSTPLSTSLIDLYSYNSFDKSSTFESSTLFSSIPLQPIPRNLINSGPLPIDRVPGSGPMERGFLSGPIERGIFSGPMETTAEQQLNRSFSHGGWRKSRKGSFIRGIRRVISKTVSRGQNSVVAPVKKEPDWVVNRPEKPANYNENLTVTSINNLSSDGSFYDDDCLEGQQNLQWAQGKAGEDRVHVVVSEEHGWVFVGIYDGFNGPDAPDYLLSQLYSAIHKELRGLLWDDDSKHEPSSDSASALFSSVSETQDTTDKEECESRNQSGDACSRPFEAETYPSPDRNSRVNPPNYRGAAKKWEENQRRWKCEWDRERLELDRRLKLQGSNDSGSINHSDVLKALSEALKKTEESYLEIADKMLMENPELALMGSCVLVMLMKGEDVYMMNVGDSRAVLAQKAEPDYRIGKARQDLERIKEETLYDIEASEWDSPSSFPNLCALQLTVDHSTSVEEEVRRIKNEHPDDSCAIVKDRVKGSLKVTRAFGAGFLKKPKWNNALLEMFRIDYVGKSSYLNCFPSLHHHRLGPKDRFLILSSDGLYQYFTNEEAVSEVELFFELQPEGDPAQHLIEQALFRAANKAGMEFHDLLEIPQGDRRRYHDDISVIVISLEGRIWRSCV